MKIIVSALEPSSNLHLKEVICYVLKNLYQQGNQTENQTKPQAPNQTPNYASSQIINHTALLCAPKNNPNKHSKIEFIGIFDKNLKEQVIKGFADFLAIESTQYAQSQAQDKLESKKDFSDFAKADFELESKPSPKPKSTISHKLDSSEFAKKASDFVARHLTFSPLFFSQDFSIMGFVDVAKKIPLILRAQKELLKSADKADKILFLDSSSFHIRLAKKIKSHNIKTPLYYYILPQVWAWKQWRTKVLERVFDKLLAILPFEAEYYSTQARESQKVRFVGHPLLDELDFGAIDKRESRQKNLESKQDFTQDFAGDLIKDIANNADNAKNTQAQNAQAVQKAQNLKRIVFMPGSRKGEIARIFPTFREVGAMLETNDFITAKSSPKSSNDFGKKTATKSTKTATDFTQTNTMQNPQPRFIKILVIPAFFADKSANELESIYGDLSGFEISFDAQASLKEADFAFICSGTATLEAALLGTPFVLCYKAARLDYFIARAFVKLRYIGLANIFYNALCGEVAGRGESKMHEELIQNDMSAQNLIYAYKKEILKAKEGHFIACARELWEYLSAKETPKNEGEISSQNAKNHKDFAKAVCKKYYGSAQNVANILLNC